MPSVRLKAPAYETSCGMNIKGVSAMSTLERIENLKDTECIVDMLLKEVRANPCQACGKCVFGYDALGKLNDRPVQVLIVRVAIAQEYAGVNCSLLVTWECDTCRDLLVRFFFRHKCSFLPQRGDGDGP